MNYYQEKYTEMKELLGNCREQLQRFEDLNNLRNSVIERLEQENQELKAQNGIEGEGQSQISEPQRSFSLNMQQVNCDKSNASMMNDISHIEESY